MNEPELAVALRALREGRVVAAATESFFGLLADAERVDAVDALLSVKPRGHEKGVPLLLPSRETWQNLVTAIPPLASLLADAFWPGPLSIALPAGAEIDRRLCVDGTLAVRLPGPSPAAELARRSGLVLTATSANPPGEKPALWTTDVERAFEAALADQSLVVVGGGAPGGAPSTLVVVEGHRLRVVREGRIALSAIEQRLASVDGL